MDTWCTVQAIQQAMLIDCFPVCCRWFADVLGLHLPQGGARRSLLKKQQERSAQCTVHSSAQHGQTGHHHARAKSTCPGL
jgi:hypothetical protein